MNKVDLFGIKNEKDFSLLALETFSYQYKNNKVYNQWCDLMGVRSVQTLSEIPFLPISFFKTHSITTQNEISAEDYFLSSGTTSMSRSKHLVYSKQKYIDNTINCFEQFFNPVSDYSYICLLPSYLEQGHSSLVCMMDSFVRLSKYSQSGFFKDELSQVIDLLEANQRQNVPTILFGVTYALLDLIEMKKLSLNSNTIVFETGGMKGRRKEMPKNELHNVLKEGLGVDYIASEYGMCELFSQAYAKREGRFITPRQMRVCIKPINDPKGDNLVEQKGVINIIDLANADTCSFIQTQDVGIMHADGSFEILGRLDNSDIRGCNLMYS